MAMDAHRLIALSIRKIAASRGQRGGVSLHKNLLVASVLFKARHVFLTENSLGACGQLQTTAAEEQPQQNITPVETDEEEQESVCDSQADPVFDQDVDNNNSVKEAEVTDNTASVVSENKSQVDEPMEVATDSEVDFEDKENSPPSASTRADLTVTVVVAESVEQLPSCAKCTTKRRLTEDGDSPSSTPVSSPSSCKRVRTCQNENVALQQHQQNIEASRHVGGTGSECTTKKMDSQRVQQMNSLVHRFNAGLTGFLSSARDNGVQRNKEEGNQCNTHIEKDAQSSHGLCGKNTVSSCSTQIKEAFETLSRPVMALAV